MGEHSRQEGAGQIGEHGRLEKSDPGVGGGTGKVKLGISTSLWVRQHKRGKE